MSLQKYNNTIKKAKVNLKQSRTQSRSNTNGIAPIILVSILFFLSGASGLIYQTVWVRLLELYFGVTLTAITLIVSAYMAGLGLGSLLGGRIAGKSRNNILLYGLIEAGIGVFGIFSPTIINFIGQNTAGSPYVLVFLLSFALLLIPTLLMGMTLPLLTQVFVTRVETSGQVIGLLYGINTLGAAIGALVSGYFLMGWLGFSGALLVAAVLNFLVGFGAMPLSLGVRRQNAQDALQTASSPLHTPSPWKFEVILVSAFLVGFIGMGFEMLWFRLLGILDKNTAYSFPSILFVYLIALALGGWFWGRRADKSQNSVELFWKLEISVGAVTAAAFMTMWVLINLPQLQPWFQDNFRAAQQPNPPLVYVIITGVVEELVYSKRLFLFGLLEYFLPILIMVLPAGMLMGGGLPVLDRIAIDQVKISGRRVGDIHLANIAGSVLGTLATSFVFLPLVGSEMTLKILSLLTLSFLGLALFTRKTPRRNSLFLAPLGLIILIILLPGKGQFYTRLYQNATSTDPERVIVRESGDAILAITFRGDKTDPSGLWIGGILNSFFPSTGSYERSVMTCASAVQPSRILIIGLGGGNTARFITSLPGVEEIVIVELLKELGPLLDEYVPVAQYIFDQPNVRYIEDDGRRYLYANPDEKFDMIFIDPLYSSTAGHNNLYSQKAMKLHQSHLSERGVFCASVNEEHFIPKTAASVFTYSDFFGDYLVNSNQPLLYDMDYMSRVYRHYLETASAHLRESAVDLMNPASVMGRLRGNQSLILGNESQTPVLRDLTPWLEYYYLCPPQFLDSLSTVQLAYCSQKK